jgi:hypothetical protein
MYNGNMYYTKKFANKGQVLMLDANYSSGGFDNSTDQEKRNSNLIDIIIKNLLTRFFE